MKQRMTGVTAAPVAALVKGKPVAMAAVVVLGVAVLAVSSWVEAPMYPVPMTLQTLAVCVVAGLCGGLVGGASVGVWYVLAMVGLPVLAGGEGGVQAFGGTTAGYLGGFLLAVVVCGRLAENPMMRGWVALAGLFVLAHVLVLGLGWARLAVLVGVGEAWTSGVAPFLVAALVKSVLAVIAVKLAERMLPTPQAV